MKTNNFAKKASPFNRLVLLAIAAIAAIGLVITACSEPNSFVAELSFISVTTAPAKTIYAIGDSLKTDGIVVTAAYSDGSKKEVTGFSTSGFDSSAEGLKTVTVTFEGKTATFNVTVSGKIVATPRASLRSGDFFAAQSVTLSTTTEGASIRYTLDGTTPTASSAAYSGAISVSGNTSLKAVAFKDGWTESGVLSADYFLTNLTADKWTDGKIISSGDEQWFKFTATDVYQRVYFTGGTASNVNVQVIDFDSLKTVPSGSSYSGSNDRYNFTSANNYIERTLIVGKDYFIRTTYNNYNSAGTYKIAFTAGITQPGMTFPDSVTELTADTWADGNIPVYGGEQWFKFTAPAASTTNWVHFMSGTMFSVNLSVYDSEGAAVGPASDHHHNSNFNKAVTVTAGKTYYVRVLARSTNGTYGTYKISFNTSSTTPKITLPDAVTLTAATWADGNFTETVREQWYKFNATNAAQYIYFQRGTLSSWTNYEVYNNAGEKIASNYSGINVGYTLLSPTPTFTPNSVYYIRLFPESSGYKGTYKIGFAATNKITPPATATELLANTWTDGNIPAMSDEQWFKFKADDSTQYIHFERGTLKGITVTLYANDGTYQRQANITDNPYYSNFQSLTFTVGNNYYVKVTPTFSETDTAYNSGTYKIGFTPERNKPGVVTTLPTTDVTVLEPGTTTTVKAVSGVGQWFKVKAVFTTLTFQGLSGNIVAELYSASGISLGGDTLTNNYVAPLDNSAGDDYYLKLTPSATGTYRIVNASAASEIIELPGAATWIDGNITATGSALGSAQVFRFTAPSAAQFILLDTSGTLNNVNVQLYDIHNDPVGSQANLNARTSYAYNALLAKGDSYLIKVWAVDTSKTGTYKIAFNSAPVLSPVNLTKDTWANGNINTASGEQWFKFNATSAVQYIKLDSLKLNSGASVQLYNANGTVRGGQETIASSASSSSILRLLTVNDTYYIRVKSDGSGTFRISFSDGSSLVSLTVGTLADGNITTAGGEQWFSFVATAATQSINFSTGTLTDVYVQLYSSDGTTVGAQTNLYGSTLSTFRTVNVGDTYLIKVWPYSSTSSGTFKIKFDVPPPPPASTPLTVDTWANGNITTVGGAQWFSFTATASQQYIHFDSTGTLTNVSVQLYQPDGVTTVGSQFNLSSSALVSYRSVTVGTPYLIKVWPYSSSNSGTFKISFNGASTPPSLPLPSSSTPLTVNIWTSGNITTAGGEQWFSFTATVSQQYIHFSTTGSLTDVYVQLYKSDGTKITREGSQTNLYGSTLYASRAVNVGDTYYIKVWPYSSSGSGTFKIGFTTSTTTPTS